VPATVPLTGAAPGPRPQVAAPRGLTGGPHPPHRPPPGPDGQLRGHGTPPAPNPRIPVLGVKRSDPPPVDLLSCDRRAIRDGQPGSHRVPGAGHSPNSDAPTPPPARPSKLATRVRFPSPAPITFALVSASLDVPHAERDDVRVVSVQLGVRLEPTLAGAPVFSLAATQVLDHIWGIAAGQGPHWCRTHHRVAITQDSAADATTGPDVRRERRPSAGRGCGSR
jgi:hypothetical protein